MSTDRDAFLQRVRQAVLEGNRAGAVPPLPERGSVGYQGAGPDPVARFRDEIVAAGGQAHLVPDPASAVAAAVELVRSCGAQRVLLGGGEFIDSLSLVPALEMLGVEVHKVTALAQEDARPAFFAADLGISGVDELIAETGTIVQATRPDQPRAVSLLPPVHIAIAHARQIVADLFDLFTRPRPDGLPACLTLITGPSKTGDIELKLVTGVHGPGEVHVIVVTDANAAHRT